MSKEEMNQTVCPICGAAVSEPVVKIFDAPIHCNLLYSSQEAARSAPRGDIFLTYCSNCGHVFNAAFDPDRMEYDAEYENSLHYSPTFQRYVESLTTDLIQRYNLNDKNLIEIGAGKGEFLEHLCRQGNNRGVGFDPSYQSQEPGMDEKRTQIIRDYFSTEYANLPVDFMLSRHVFEHVYNPFDFLQELREIIADRMDVTVFFEVPNAVWTLQDLGIWDLIYEHYSYFTQSSLEYVFEHAGFCILHSSARFNRQFLTIEAQPSKEKGGTHPRGDTRQLTDLVECFASRYQEKFASWQQRLEEMRQNGELAAVWGAGSKGVTFMNVLPTESVVTQVIDINPNKQGNYVAGTGLKIISPEQLPPDQHPEKIIIMNSNYADEIEKKMQALSIHAQVLIA